MKRLITIVLTLAIALVLVATPASAAKIEGLDNTGIDLDNNGYDDNFTVVSAPAPIQTPTAFIVDGIWPEDPGPWISNNFLSDWIAPWEQYGTDGRLTHPTGEYVFQDTFTVSEADAPVIVTLSGLWTTDNQGLDIQVLLDGVPLSVLTTPAETAEKTYTDLHAFEATFLVGPDFGQVGNGGHDLQFVIYNLSVGGEAVGQTGNGNPAGLRVQYDLDPFQQIPVPEPATLGIWAIGLGLAGFGIRRRRRK